MPKHEQENPFSSTSGTGSTPEQEMRTWIAQNRHIIGSARQYGDLFVVTSNGAHPDSRSCFTALIGLAVVVFDLFGLPIVFSHWQFLSGVFWVSLLGTFALASLWLTGKPVLGWFAHLSFSAGWGAVGWTLGMSIHVSWLPAPVLLILFSVIGFLVHCNVIEP